MYPNYTTTKTANINQAGKGQTFQVPVTQDTTTEVMLRQAGLDPRDLDVATPAGDRLLALQDKPWDVLTSPHDVISVSPSAQVG